MACLTMKNIMKKLRVNLTIIGEMKIKHFGLLKCAATVK